MGVKDLWNILSPLCERKPLFELQGKVVAIDLSCWIVDSQSIGDTAAQPKLYLRNLFFRTSYFLLHNITPVFVLEGKAPELKQKTIAKRNEIRSGKKSNNSKGNRSRFNSVLRECEEMLKFMGLVCVHGYGEAEAMCAYLNEDGLVDGCISQDSDCFLYGAKVVYRNFCTSSQGNRGGSAGSIDEYTLEKAEKEFNLGRNKMVALALLCGCDYDDGVNGVGKEAALKLFKVVDEDSIIERLKSWRRDKRKYERLEAEISNPKLCTSCGHAGKLRQHTKLGCEDCGTTEGCSSSYKEQKQLITNEINLRKKCMAIDEFPNQELLDEFFIRSGPVPTRLHLQWKEPRIREFIDFMEKKLQWEPGYAFAKIFSITARWQLLALAETPPRAIRNPLVPKEIKKIRRIRCVASYEIIWDQEKSSGIAGLKLGMTSDKESNEDEEEPQAEPVLSSIEPQGIVSKCYPSLVQEFEEKRNAKKKKKTTGRRKKADKETAEEGTARKPSKRPAKKKDDSKNNRKMDEFVQKQPPPQNNSLSLETSLESINITPKRSKLRQPAIDRILASEKKGRTLNNTLDVMFNELTPDDFLSDEEEAMDLSEIVDQICNKKTFDCNQITSPRRTSSRLSHRSDDKCGDMSDLEDQMSVCSLTCASVVKKVSSSETEDEFDLFEKNYVPLEERLKMNI